MSNVKKSIRLNVKCQKSIRSNVKCQKSIRSNVKCQKSIRSNVKCKKSIRSNVKCQKSIRIILTERTSGVPPVIFSSDRSSLHYDSQHCQSVIKIAPNCYFMIKEVFIAQNPFKI